MTSIQKALLVIHKHKNLKLLEEDGTLYIIAKGTNFRIRFTKTKFEFNGKYHKSPVGAVRALQEALSRRTIKLHPNFRKSAK